MVALLRENPSFPVKLLIKGYFVLSFSLKFLFKLLFKRINANKLKQILTAHKKHKPSHKYDDFTINARSFIHRISMTVPAKLQNENLKFVFVMAIFRKQKDKAKQYTQRFNHRLIRVILENRHHSLV